MPAESVTLCGVPGLREIVVGLAVTSAGSPLRATLTVPVNPFNAVAVTCTAWPAPPLVTLRDDGATASEKSGWGGGGAVTVMAKDVVCVCPPAVPVNVAVADPGAVPVGADSVSIAAVPGVRVREAGCKVTPVGNPLTLTGMLDEKPFSAVATREAVAAVPFAGRLTDAGVTLREKLGIGPVAAWTER